MENNRYMSDIKRETLLHEEIAQLIAERDSLNEQLQKAQEEIITLLKVANKSVDMINKNTEAIIKLEADKAEAVMVAVRALERVCNCYKKSNYYNGTCFNCSFEADKNILNLLQVRSGRG